MLCLPGPYQEQRRDNYNAAVRIRILRGIRG
jgi:hypothetical protein